MLTGIIREKNGRKTRKKQTIENTRKIQNIVIIQRQRLYHIPDHMATQQKAGSVIGRMTLKGLLNEEHYQAAHYWCAVVERYRLVCQSPGFYRLAYPETLLSNTIIEKNISSILSEREEKMRDQRWIAHYQQARKCILKTHIKGLEILDLFIFQDVFPQQKYKIKIARACLSALAFLQKFGVTEQNKDHGTPGVWRASS